MVSVPLRVERLVALVRPKVRWALEPLWRREEIPQLALGRELAAHAHVFDVERAQVSRQALEQEQECPLAWLGALVLVGASAQQ